MYLAIDVYYGENDAKAVGLSFSVPDEDILNTSVAYIDKVEEYVPGEFYKRELPCIEKLLEQVEQQSFKAIIIDGHIYINNIGDFGLGGKLWETLDKKVPIIGVAKNAFNSNKATVKEIYRGQSKKPLYVSAIGMPLENAAELVLNMKGKNRIPDLLKQVDSITKQP